MRIVIGATVAALTIWQGSARAQTNSGQRLWVAAAAQIDVQRFAGNSDGVPNRLDGSAAGGTVLGAVRPWNHVATRVEWTYGGTIEDVRDTSLDLVGRTVTIHSTLAHHTRTLAVLAGFEHAASTRATVAYVAGVAVTWVRCAFTTNAPGVILVGPSNADATTTVRMDDRSVTPVAGVDLVVVLRGRLYLVTGARAQKVTLPSDLFGWSFKPFAGVGWAF